MSFFDVKRVFHRVFAEALLAGRPLPESPFGQEILSSKWMSKENLLSSPEESDDPNLFVALFEFSAGGENQLCLNKGKFICRFNPKFHCYVRCCLQSTCMLQFLSTCNMRNAEVRNVDEALHLMSLMSDRMEILHLIHVYVKTPVHLSSTMQYECVDRIGKQCLEFFKTFAFKLR